MGYTVQYLPQNRVALHCFIFQLPFQTLIDSCNFHRCSPACITGNVHYDGEIVQAPVTYNRRDILREFILNSNLTKFRLPVNVRSWSIFTPSTTVLPDVCLDQREFLKFEYKMIFEGMVCITTNPCTLYSTCESSFRWLDAKETCWSYVSFTISHRFLPVSGSAAGMMLAEQMLSIWAWTSLLYWPISLLRNLRETWDKYFSTQF